MSASTGHYPYDIHDDGTAICYACGGDGSATLIDGSRAGTCGVCHGDGFVSAAKVARFIIASVEAEADERARRGFTDAVYRLQSFLDQLPNGHQDRAGVIRSIEVLGGEPRLREFRGPLFVGGYEGGYDDESEPF